ncbi:MAG: transketolase [Alphaproteobacteria bacterium]|nr:transketolase [Alphaproteobacteria bacterium]
MSDATAQDANSIATAMADAVRVLSAEAVQAANSGHPGMPMGMADVATVLFRDVMTYDASWPQWPDRDRLILSAGHGSMLLYSALYLAGYQDVPIEEIRNFRQLGSKTPGHPEYGHTEGVETTTGPLGQGIANSVGFAMAEKWLAARCGDELVNHYTYVIAGDGCMMEGVSQEAISLAGHLELDKLIVLWDDNQITIDGKTDLSTSEDQRQRFEAAGWHVQAVDGHDQEAILTAVELAQAETGKPSMIACRTTIGFGSPTVAGTSKAHGAPLGAEGLQAFKDNIGWTHDPFVVPNETMDAWRAAGARGKGASDAWKSRLAASPQADQFNAMHAGALTDAAREALTAIKEGAISDQPALATRACSGKVLEALIPTMPSMLGGSADLTGSNNTKTSHHSAISANDFAANYVNYGVREHGMAAAMNGMALHGGVIPYAGTFLVFTDYARPAIRLSALMKQRVIYVMTHDSIGLGEDGPTHQPVEHLAALRAIPGLLVFRPADLAETAEAWELALDHDGPSVLALSRQKVPALRRLIGENYSATGGYIFRPAMDERKVTLISSGTELSLAVEAQEELEREHGIPTAVVSLISWELFEQQPAHYREEVLSPGSLRVGIEAGSDFGWRRWLREDGHFIGVGDQFGASAPAEQLYEHFGITKAAIVQSVLDRL